MFEALLEYIGALPLTTVEGLDLEDAALCLAWHESYAGNVEVQHRWVGVLRAVEHWVAHARHEEPATKGRRHQWILRDLIDELGQKRLPLMNRAQVDLLCAVRQLIERVAHPDSFVRIRELLEPHAKNLQMRRAGFDAEPGLPNLTDRVTIATQRELEQAAPREVRFIAGIEWPAIGPVFTHKGRLKVFGDVPENCTVVVEDGPCSITGYVFGRVAAKMGCEVRENTAGLVVVSEGDVRGRSAVQNANIIAKQGCVFLHTAQNPQHIFAWDRIDIAENAMLGKYTSQRIGVANEALGGEFHVSGELTASRFRRDDTHDPVIVLRRYVSGADYGEVVKVDAARLMAHAARLHRRLANIRQVMELAAHEAGNYAEHALIYLAGGESVRKSIEEIDISRQRLAVLERIVAGLQSLSLAAEDTLHGELRTDSQDRQASERTAAEDDSPSFTEDLDRELAELAATGSIDADLVEARTEMTAMDTTLKRQRADRQRVSELLVRIEGKAAGWLSERKRLLETIQRKQAGIAQFIERAEAVLRGKGEGSKVEMLTQLLAAARTRPSGDPIVQRARSPFTRLLVKCIENRLGRTKRYAHTVDTIRKELDAANAELRRDSLALFCEAESEGVQQARVTGRFDAGVRICSDSLLLDEPDLPPGLVIRTPCTGSAVTTFVRQKDGIVELP